MQGCFQDVECGVFPCHEQRAMRFAGDANEIHHWVEVSVRALFAAFGLMLFFFLPAGAAQDAETTYKGQCMKCHGVNGDGAGHANLKIKPTDLRSDAVQKLSDEELFKTIAYGVGHKEYAHAFAERGLSQKQIADLVSYIRKFAKPSKKDK
jgi:mono/diheme cytochrome c family protein